jgi:hypothetical protein
LIEEIPLSAICRSSAAHKNGDQLIALADNHGKALRIAKLLSLDDP